MQSCAHYFFPSSARHQDYQKPGKPSMATSSSSALEEREPTSASRLRGWGPEPLWSARCVTRNKFAATLCGFVLSLCYDLCAGLDSSKNACVVSFFFACWRRFWQMCTLFSAHHQPSTAMFHQLVNGSLNPYSFVHTSVISPHQLSVPHFVLINTMPHAYAHLLLRAFKQAYSHIMQPRVSNQ